MFSFYKIILDCENYSLFKFRRAFMPRGKGPHGPKKLRKGKKK